MSKPAVEHYFDVVIVGAGMAGASLACALSAQAKPPSIALLEATDLDFGQHPGFDGRAIALAARSVNWLNQQGLWDALAPKSAAIEHINVSDQGHLGRVELAAKTYCLADFGHVVELEQAGKALHHKLSQYANVQLFCPSQLTTLEQQQDHCRLVLSSGECLRTALVVGADGGHSAVAKLVQLKAQTHDFGKVALIANVQSSQRPAGRAFERFTQDGPLALLPMSEDRWSLVWSLSPERAKQLQQANSSDFLAALQQQVAYRCGQFIKVGQRHAYPLCLRQQPCLFSHRVVLVGNAAHSLHPVAGQGFNLGLRDVAELSQGLNNAWQQQADMGRFKLLQTYQQARKVDIANTIAMTSSLAHLFSSNDKHSVLPRNLALLLMQRCPSLQLPLIKQSLGY